MWPPRQSDLSFLKIGCLERLGTHVPMCFARGKVLSGAYDEKCDIWSCGVICYILMCGFLPLLDWLIVVDWNCLRIAACITERVCSQAIHPSMVSQLHIHFVCGPVLTSGTIKAVSGEKDKEILAMVTWPKWHMIVWSRWRC